jgi:hypothetical protein
MPDLFNFDPGLTTTSFKGVPISGYADDDITAELDEDAFTDKAGNAGDVVRTRNRNMLGDVTIPLLAESPVNDRLSAIADLDMTGAGAGVGPFTLRNANSTTVLHAAKAWIKKRPAVASGKESGPRVWVIRCVFDVFKVGGSLV